MTRSRPATLDSRLVETGGYGAAMVLLPATLVGVGFLGSGPIADAIGLAIATAALIVVLAAATAQGRAPLVVAATTGGVAVLAIAVVFEVIDRGTSLPFLVQAE
jgi:predicted branched-subunit amino acid permease